MPGHAGSRAIEPLWHTVRIVSPHERLSPLLFTERSIPAIALAAASESDRRPLRRPDTPDARRANAHRRRGDARRGAGALPVGSDKEVRVIPDEKGVLPSLAMRMLSFKPFCVSK